MEHTEESLMALAQVATVAAAKSPYLGENHYLIAQDALRLAIREVLAERDERPTKRLWDETATALETLRVKFHNVNAECERLRRDAERGRFMLKHGEWRRNSEYRTTHIAVAVPFDSDLSCYATRETAIDAAMQEKQL